VARSRRGWLAGASVPCEPARSGPGRHRLWQDGRDAQTYRIGLDVMARWWTLAGEDLRALSGKPLRPVNLVANLAVRAPWRAALMWRAAQACMQRSWQKPLGLWLTDRILSSCGAELQPSCTIGPGVIISETVGVVVGGEVVAGRSLVLHGGVTLGDRVPYGGQPRLGDDVVVGAGACVLGPVTIGDRVVIAPHSVVLADVPSDSSVAGAPARVVGPASDEREPSAAR
jgi:serine O-acetyltransferase